MCGAAYGRLKPSAERDFDLRELVRVKTSEATEQLRKWNRHDTLLS